MEPGKRDHVAAGFRAPFVIGPVDRPVYCHVGARLDRVPEPTRISRRRCGSRQPRVAGGAYLCKHVHAGQVRALAREYNSNCVRFDARVATLDALGVRAGRRLELQCGRPIRESVTLTG